MRFLRGQIGVLQTVEDQLHRLYPESSAIHTSSGEGSGEHAEHCIIIEPGDGHILGNAQAALQRGLYGPVGHQIVHAHNSGWAWGSIEHLVGCGETIFECIPARDYDPVGGWDPLFFHFPMVDVGTIFTSQVILPANSLDEGNPPVA
jgi:hypothetical protein